MTDAELKAKDALIFSALVNIGADVIEENKNLQDKIKHLETRVEKLKETLTIAEKTIYDSTEMFAHYDDCVALVTDEDEPDYECTCGRDKMVLRTIDARFLIKAALQEDEGMR